MKSELLNRVLPVKQYEIYDANARVIGTVVADNVNEAFRIGRLDYGPRCRAAALKKTNALN